MTTPMKTQLDYVSLVGNFLLNKICSSKFSDVAKAQQALKTELQKVPEIFGETALHDISQVNSSLNSHLNPITVACYHIIRLSQDATTAKSFFDLSEAEQYMTPYFDDLWEAVTKAGIEYTDPDYPI